MKKKHDLMYELFGRDEAHICRECCNFGKIERGRNYSKCRIYGVSCSTATDWSGKKAACGRFNDPPAADEPAVIDIKKRSKKEIIQIQCEGQMSLF